MPDQTVRLFGIRHHGPGAPRSLLRALEKMQPDCLLIEGPPDGESVLPFVLESGMCPPVALLVYAPDDSRRAVFYPFAEFSPEWQALRYGLGQSLPVRFMDLPIAHQFGLDKAFEDECRAAEEEALREAEEHTKTEPVESTENPLQTRRNLKITAMTPLLAERAPNSLKAAMRAVRTETPGMRRLIWRTFTAIRLTGSDAPPDTATARRGGTIWSRSASTALSCSTPSAKP